MPPRYKFEFRFFFLNFFRCCSGDMERKGVPSNPVDSDAETQPLESDLSSEEEFSSDSDEGEDEAELPPEFKGVSTSDSPTVSLSSSGTTIPDLTPSTTCPTTTGSSGAIPCGIHSAESEVERLLSMGNIPQRIIVSGSSGRRSTWRSPHSLLTILPMLEQTRLSRD